ncbi:MAG TPA: hypothetical protein VGO70_07080 [Arsenicitalea sp.]|jgi:hypothetical protein|nr:hypothetical protein [Arsenicitalea sp.]
MILELKASFREPEAERIDDLQLPELASIASLTCASQIDLLSTAPLKRSRQAPSIAWSMS